VLNRLLGRETLTPTKTACRHLNLSLDVPDMWLDMFAPLTSYHVADAARILTSERYRDFYAKRRKQGATVVVWSVDARLEWTAVLSAARMVDANVVAVRAPDYYHLGEGMHRGGAEPAMIAAPILRQWEGNDVEMDGVVREAADYAREGTTDVLLEGYLHVDPLEFVRACGAAGRPLPQVHIVGTYADAAEVASYAGLAAFQNVAGVATAVAAKSALRGRWFDAINGWDCRTFKSARTPFDASFREMDERDAKVAMHNHYCLLRWANGWR
jgi:hypothetical protein